MGMPLPALCWCNGWHLAATPKSVLKPSGCFSSHGVESCFIITNVTMEPFSAQHLHVDFSAEGGSVNNVCKSSAWMSYWGNRLACPKSDALICLRSSLSLVLLFLKEAKEKFNGISHGGGREQSICRLPWVHIFFFGRDWNRGGHFRHLLHVLEWKCRDGIWQKLYKGMESFIEVLSLGGRGTRSILSLGRHWNRQELDWVLQWILALWLKEQILQQTIWVRTPTLTLNYVVGPWTNQCPSVPQFPPLWSGHLVFDLRHLPFQEASPFSACANKKQNYWLNYALLSIIRSTPVSEMLKWGKKMHILE